MLIGIDVGGTFTDAVVIANGKVLKSNKQRTTKENLMTGILSALDAVLPVVRLEEVEKVTLSTTVVTNRLVEHKESKVDLYIVPGPGMNLRGLLPVEPIVLKGYTDHQGKIVANWQLEDPQKQQKNSPYAAVSVKFGVRNPKEEQRLAEKLDGYQFISEGAKLSGNLNFIRRTVSAYYNSAIWEPFGAFKKAVIEALQQRNIQAPVYILKADGGSLPIEVMTNRPVESAFTGPAASVLGMKALGHIPNSKVVALDIGGTTTDISLWSDGEPLMARGGVNITEYPSAVRSFEVKSVGIGGESAITITSEGSLQVGPERKGPSVALGGTIPTLGDALIAAHKATYGNVEAAKQAILELARQVDMPLSDTINLILEKALLVVKNGIQETIQKANRLPVYTVEDIIHPDFFSMEKLLIVGGTAESFGPILGDYLAVPIEIPPAAAVANAIGAAVALENISLTLRVDTTKRSLVIPELGINASTSISTEEEAIHVGETYLRKEAEKIGLENIEIEVTEVEDFPVIQGWQSMGHLITLHLQLKSGVLHHVEI